MKHVIAVDATPAMRAALTGTERYARELIRRLPAAAPEFDWRLYASRPERALDGIDPSGAVNADLTVLPFGRLWSQARLPIELAARPPDLLFVPSHVVPFAYRGRALTTVHDLAFERFPEAYSAGQRRYLRLTTRWAVRRCPRLLTVSEATRGDLADLYGVDPARVDVAPLGVTPPPPPPSPDTVVARLAALGVARPFALHVGRVESRKNQAAAIAAAQQAGIDLVCAGSIVDPVLGARLRESPRARLLGRASHQDLEVLYAAAECLVFPSLYEGFGLPILEAMARGLPVVTVRSSSLPEAGGEAAIYASGPADVQGLAAGIERARGPERGSRVVAGRRHAAGFTWDATARAVAGTIRRLLS